jgi:hypothetical protein
MYIIFSIPDIQALDAWRVPDMISKGSDISDDTQKLYCLPLTGLRLTSNLGI